MNEITEYMHNNGWVMILFAVILAPIIIRFIFKEPKYMIIEVFIESKVEKKDKIQHQIIVHNNETNISNLRELRINKKNHEDSWIRENIRWEIIKISESEINSILDQLAEGIPNPVLHMSIQK